MSKYLVIDGMVSGTGIRNQDEGGYIDPKSLKISYNLVEKLRKWHEKYKEQFYENYINKFVIQELDKEGIEISRAISQELENCKISYYSDANLSKQLIEK